MVREEFLYEDLENIDLKKFKAIKISKLKLFYTGYFNGPKPLQYE